jgi:hypothetical protein
MAIKKTISNLGGGADLLRPQMNLTYIAAATVGIVVLLFVWKMGGLIFAKGTGFVESRIPGGKAVTIDYKEALGIV